MIAEGQGKGGKGLQRPRTRVRTCAARSSMESLSLYGQTFGNFLGRSISLFPQIRAICPPVSTGPFLFFLSLCAQLLQELFWKITASEKGVLP